MIKKVVWGLQASALLLLSACGGGGGGSQPPPTLPTNRAPFAAPQANTSTAYSSQTVTLNGSTSVDPDGTLSSFAWTQTAGPTVSLAAANTSITTFTSPAVASRTTLTFRLTVTDNGGATGFADVNVTVDPAAVDFSLSLLNARSFVVDDETALVRRTTAIFQGQTVAVTGVAWTSNLQGNLTGSATDLATRQQAGSPGLRTCRATSRALPPTWLPGCRPARMSSPRPWTSDRSELSPKPWPCAYFRASLRCLPISRRPRRTPRS